MPDDLHSPDSNTAEPQHHASKHNLRNSINSSKITWKTYDDLKVEPQSWLIQGLIPADSLVMLYGARGQGKTFLALDIAASVASGRAWLGCPVVQKGKVCYLLAERPEGIARRMAGWLQHTGATPDEIQNVFVADAGAIKIDDDDGVNKIVASIHSELKIGSTLLDARSGQTPPPAADCLQLLVIDPMAAYMRGAENDAGETTKFMHCARRISAHFGCSVLFVHHEGKGNYNNSLGARGSSAIEAALDTILYLEPDKDDETLSVLSMTKQRDFKEFPDMWLKFEGRVGVPQGNGHTTEIMDLGKYPVMAAKPEKAPSKRDLTNAAKKRVRNAIHKIICDRTRAFPNERTSIAQVADDLLRWAKRNEIQDNLVNYAALTTHIRQLKSEGFLLEGEKRSIVCLSNVPYTPQ